MKTTFSELTSLFYTIKDPGELNSTTKNQTKYILFVSQNILSIYNGIISTFLAFKKEIEYMNNTLLCTYNTKAQYNTAP